MTVTRISSPNHQTTKRAKAGSSNSRGVRKSKAAKDVGGLTDTLVFFIVEHLHEHNPRPWFPTKRQPRIRLKSKVLQEIRTDGRVKREAQRNNIAEQVIKRAVDAGYIRIYECPDAKGKFTSEVTPAGRLWLERERCKANHPSRAVIDSEEDSEESVA